VEASALGRFLPAWQGVGAPRQGPDALAEVIGQLQGAGVPASVLESDVLPARVRGYRGADLDALCASGEVVWIGTGALGATDGRIALYFRDQAPALWTPPAGDLPEGIIHDAIRRQLTERGASFWPDLVAAAGTADEPIVLAALWDLVWAGEVTNDTLAPVRALGWRRPKAPKGRPGRLRAAGPPSGAGRWSLVEPLVASAPSPTEQAHARALQLLDRHGVLTREAVRAEGVPGGFSGVYGVLKAFEESGRVRRGYFVAGLGAAQFSLPGAVDRLRAARAASEDEVIVLAASDPAQPYGAALGWPDAPGGRPSRAAGAYVALRSGDLACYLERGGRSLVTFPAATSAEWAEALGALVKDGRIRKLQIERIDGGPAPDSPHAPALRDAGFADAYKGLVYRG
jgi:ATP-dependent Lhr-like helicase